MVLFTVIMWLFMLLIAISAIGFTILTWLQSSSRYYEQNGMMTSEMSHDTFYSAFRLDRTDDELSQTAQNVQRFKQKVLLELRRVHLESGRTHVLQQNSNNYGIKHKGRKSWGWPKDEDVPQIMCSAPLMKMMTKRDFKHLNISVNIPSISFDKQFGMYNTCSIVTNAGALLGSKLGRKIDAHDAVIRFNNAPSGGRYAKDVGEKTTLRIVNSQVIAKEHFNFFTSHLYKNVTLVAWDPSKYTDSLSDWAQQSDFNVLPKYRLYRNKNPDQPFYILHPKSIWDAWDFLNTYTPGTIYKNPPSSGFLGMLILLNHCRYLSLFEYMPSMRKTDRCHYYDNEINAGCTLGEWHPLAASKLLAYKLQTAPDKQVFVEGQMVITKPKCPYS